LAPEPVWTLRREIFLSSAGDQTPVVQPGVISTEHIKRTLKVITGVQMNVTIFWDMTKVAKVSEKYNDSSFSVEIQAASRKKFY
jgi:hypothetical protein